MVNSFKLVDVKLMALTAKQAIEVYYTIEENRDEILKQISKGTKITRNHLFAVFGIIVISSYVKQYIDGKRTNIYTY